ncbi:hypothetical protein [Leptospira mayottensis]|nr:hypothetical protein [Leptospira mayottensis]
MHLEESFTALPKSKTTKSELSFQILVVFIEVFRYPKPSNEKEHTL